MTAESDAVKSVAGLMALAARTAPKAVGLDSIKIEIVTGKEQAKLADEMMKIGKESGMGFFLVNGDQVRESDATILIGVEGRKTLGINCGGCDFAVHRSLFLTTQAGASKGNAVVVCFIRPPRSCGWSRCLWGAFEVEDGLHLLLCGLALRVYGRGCTALSCRFCRKE